ncbi:MAG: PIN domain protein [Chloracidobacterium sp.]|nr:PIN domain protein [Chloracidobacterium sp.]
MRIYIDTSVVGGYFDDEFAESTKSFFEKVEYGDFTLVVSELLEAELLDAPLRVRDLLTKYPSDQIELAALSPEAKDLANEYVVEKVVGATSIADCQHIAIATIAKVDVLVSWNFKHIVNLKRIRGYNEVNTNNGYSTLEIRTPAEVIDYEIPDKKA